MAEALFDLFWKNHPSLQSPPVTDPCMTNGKRNHEHQCVIRLGIAMTKSGVSLASYRGVFCWSGHQRTHPLRVPQMTAWLQTPSANFVPKAKVSKRTKATPQKSYQDFSGRRGIVALYDFWGPTLDGDHIDLWNGSMMAGGDTDYFAASREIWFWEMK